MSKKILVAGAGHGGLVAAAYLAEKGYKVEIFEQMKREELGYDWHDTIKNYTFDLAGIKNVDKKDIHMRKDNVFYPPSLGIEVVVDETPQERVDYEVDRKVIYRYLIDNAVEKGVKINYEQKVSGPYVVDGKVKGIVVGGKNISGDLVIDSAGMYSPVLNNLPDSYSISSNYTDNDIFHTFRGYFNLVEGEKIVNPTRFNVYFKFCGIKGIAWFKITENMADVLVGSVDPLDMEGVNSVLSELRKAQPALGTKILRGGQIKDIPLKSTLTLLVGDNYALVGDAASMPLPLNGSGITNSIAAGKMLAETVLEAGDSYNAASLWSYQVKYFKEIGSKMTGVYVMKNCLLGYSVKALNFLFEKQILTAKELGAGSTGKELEVTKADVIDKLKRGITHPISLIKLKNAGVSAKKVKAAALAIPDSYDKAVVEAWRGEVEALLK
jgi:flavin-dependent dehydrogenase